MAAYEKPPQVFMNFRGAELRQSFISHLEMALRRSGVNVYVDHAELIGEPLESIFKGINESMIALVIFSERYTESSWCLDELVKIQERVEEGKLTAIPIYYKLNPSQVRSLDGDFGLNLWNHVKHTSNFDKFNKWKEALKFFSEKLGLVFNEKSISEFTFINEITFHVHEVLRRDDDLNLRKDDDFVVEANPTMVTLPKHKVVISFRGNEVNYFVSYLVGALRSNGVSICCFEEDELRVPNLAARFMRIEESMIALVFFSSTYSESAWCLDELVKIKEFMDKGKLVAVPIFYKVEPSQVTNLMGEFGDNFRNMYLNQNRDALKWKEALKSVSSRKGIYVKEYSSEHEIISSIVTNTLRVISELGREKHETYVGMEQRMEQLEKKLEFACNETRIIGVVGAPGIGKTTLAMMLFEKLKRRFTCSVSLLDIRKKSEDYGPLQLRKKLLEDLLVGKFPMISEETTHGPVKMELLKTKIFLVLDDVSDKKQLEFLLGNLDWIKKGSKIVITTSDKSLLDGIAHDTHVVPRLNDKEAFELFSYHAFGDRICNPVGIFLTLSRVVVDYARGHPLVLKLLASGLRGKDEDHWASILEKVTKESNLSVGHKWRLFTDHLNEKQKDVFLDIVFFFKSEDEYFVRSLLDSGDPVSEVKDLVNKSLITIAGGRVEMNVPLFMFFTNLDSRWLRLWNYTDIIKKLRKRGKSDDKNVRGIFFDISKLEEDLSVDNSTFMNMRNLRYLKIYDSCCPPQCEADYELNFPDGLEFLMEEVRYLHWVKFPLKELPPDFRPANLVDLTLPYSKITRLWKGEKVTPRLKMVDLSHSRELLDLSALSNAENLQSLNLEGCTSMEEFPVTIQNMKCLVYLNLRGCISLWSLPKMNFISLKTLILSDCSNLEEFQLISESLEFLHLDGTAIKGLPPAIQNLQRLIVLNLKNCKMLECLPSCIGNLKALDKLILSGCSRLKNLPDVRKILKHLRILHLDGTGAKEIIGSEDPPSADMFLQPCSMREWPSSLQRLCLSENDFVSLQFDIWKLYNLKWLDVKDCKKLISIPLLPPKLQYFDAHGCDSLQSVANPIACSVLPDQIHSTFNFSNCNSLDQDAKDSIISYTRWRSQLVLDEHKRYNGGLLSEALVGTCFPGWEVPVWFSHRAAGSVLNSKLPPHWFDNNFTGIGLCVVIIFDGSYNQRERVLVKCNCEFKNEDKSSIRFSCTVGGWGKPSNSPQKIESSHVLIGFTSRMDLDKTSEEDDGGKCVFTETFIEFEVTDGMEKIKGCEVVKCGFTLVYAPQERANMALHV